MKSETFELSLSQQFEIRKIALAAPNMSKEQLSEMLLEVYSLLMVKDNVIKHLIKTHGV